LSLLLVRLDPLGLRVCPESGFSEGDLGGLDIPDPYLHLRLLSREASSPALQQVCFEMSVANQTPCAMALECVG